MKPCITSSFRRIPIHIPSFLIIRKSVLVEAMRSSYYKPLEDRVRNDIIPTSDVKYASLVDSLRATKMQVTTTGMSLSVVHGVPHQREYGIHGSILLPQHTNRSVYVGLSDF